MRVLTDVRRGEWIVERAGTWATVGGVAGTGFEAYARLLHPVDAQRADLTRTDEWGQHPIVEETTWPWAAVAARTGRVMHPLVQWRRVTEDESLVDFDDGWGLLQIREGWFDPRLFAALTVHLAAETTTPDDIVAAIWNGWGFENSGAFYMSSAGDEDDAEESERDRASVEQMMRDAASAVSPELLDAVKHDRVLEYPGRGFVLLQATLTELSDPGWGHRAGIGWTSHHPDPTPQMFWPGDHVWVVASEIDWDSTIVAGSRALVDAVLADPTFEGYEVQENDKLTWDGDPINT